MRNLQQTKWDLSSASQRMVGGALLMLAVLASCSPAGSSDRDDPQTVDAEDSSADVADTGLDGDSDTGREIRDTHDAGTPVRTPETQFVLREVSAIDEHFMRIQDENSVAWEGIGGAFFDMDGDQDLDIFLGGHLEAGTGACILENRSSPGTLSFEPVTGYCGDPSFDKIYAGVAFDLESDGIHELAFAGQSNAGVLSVDRGVVSQNFVAELSGPDDSTLCGIGTVTVEVYDHDLDGDDDIAVVCRAGSARENGGMIVFDSAPDGFEPFESNSLNASSYVMAVGFLDADKDGLLDLVMLNGARHLDEFINFAWNPGGVFVRDVVAQLTSFKQRKFVEGLNGYGSFMGVAKIYIDGIGDALVVTDWGPNRVLLLDDSWSSDGASYDYAEQTNLRNFKQNDTILAKWSAVAADFNFDGLEDLMITEGGGLVQTVEEFRLHRDRVWIQQQGGSFQPFSEEVGLPSFDETREDLYQGAPASRATIRADLDGDGFVEWLILPAEGSPKIYTETPDDPDKTYCTIIPRPIVSDTLGIGYRLHITGYAAPLTWHVRGQSRGGTTPWLLSPSKSGFVEFPSGARVPFTCEADSHQVVVHESNWLSIADTESSAMIVTADISAMNLDGSAASAGVNVDIHWVDAEGEVQPNADEQCDTFEPCQLEPPAEAEAFMLRVNERWVPRAFAVGVPFP